MGKPTIQEIADALQISKEQVNQLGNRGMPLNKIKKAREWFDANGFRRTFHSKSGGAANSGPSMKTTIKSALGHGRGVMPSNAPSSAAPQASAGMKG